MRSAEVGPLPPNLTRPGNRSFLDVGSDTSRLQIERALEVLERLEGPDPWILEAGVDKYAFTFRGLLAVGSCPDMPHVDMRYMMREAAWKVC